MVSVLDVDEFIATNKYLNSNRIQDKTIYDAEDKIDETTETKKDSVMYNFTVINQKSLEYKNIFIDSLNSETYKLKKLISVTIEYDNKNYIARNYDLGLYGYGDTEIEALDYLKELIVETYEELKDENNLSSTLKLMMIYCKEIIEKK